MTNFNIKTICKVSRNCEGLTGNPRKEDVAALIRFCLTRRKSYVVSRVKSQGKSFTMAEVSSVKFAEVPLTVFV